MGKKSPANIALERASQTAFTKAMTAIKGLVKKGEITVDESQPAAALARKNKTRGGVCLSHVPHGFYEDQMSSFFSQFGGVTRLKLYRSPKTGKSKGYAFIEFYHKEVAEIVAETMNNYLMFTRLVKASYIPPDKLSDAMFLGGKFKPENCPGIARRNLNRRLHNRVVLAPVQAKKRLARSRCKLKSMQQKLDKLGIDYKIQLGGKAVALKTEDDTMSTNTSEVTEVTPVKSKKQPRSVKTSENKEMTPGTKSQKRKSQEMSAADISGNSVKKFKTDPLVRTPKSENKIKKGKSPQSPITVTERNRKSISTPQKQNMVVSSISKKNSTPSKKVEKSVTATKNTPLSKKQKKSVSPEKISSPSKKLKKSVTPTTSVSLSKGLKKSITPKGVATPLKKQKSVTPKEVATPLKKQKSVTPKEVATPLKKQKSVTPKEVSTPSKKQKSVTPIKIASHSKKQKKSIKK